MLLRCLSRLSRPAIQLLGPKKEVTSSAWINFESRNKLHNFPKTDIRRNLHSDFDKTKPLELETYEHVCSETLESLSDYYEQAVEDCPHLKDPDVSIGDGVLNIQFGAPYGSYVINRQRPNLQIWLSSPTSGPKRYDFIDGRWIYKHDGVCLHDLLEKETSEILKQPVDLSSCAFYKV